LKTFPLVSVIVPTYNRAKLIHETLDSILIQSYINFELIIIDDGSTDNTEDVVMKYADKRIYYIKTNNWGGPAKPRNIGIKKAKGEFIAFCDDDDIWKPKKLEISVKYLLKYSVDIVYHDLYYLRENGLRTFLNGKNKTRKLDHSIKNDLLFNGNGINNSSVVVKKKALYDIGLITEDKNKISWEDYHTWIKLAENKCNFKQIPHCLGYYRIGNNKISFDAQVVRNHENIILHYSNDIDSKDIWWINYIEARLFYNNKKYQSAIRRLNNIDLNSISFILILKIYVLLLLSQVGIVFRLKTQ